MADNEERHNFGLSIRDRTFYETALTKKAWVNLASKNSTYTGRVVSFNPLSYSLVLNPYLDSIYSLDGIREFGLLPKDLELDLVLAEIVSKSIASEEEAKGRVASYNRELDISRKLQLAQLAKCQ